MAEDFKQVKAAGGVFGCLLLAYNSFTQQIDGEADPLFVALTQRLHEVARIFSGDELPRHTRDVPAQNLTA